MGKYQVQPLEGSQELWARLVRAAMKAGNAESSSEAQYTHALAWLETKRSEATTDDETDALDRATNCLAAELDHVRHPERRA